MVTSTLFATLAPVPTVTLTLLPTEPTATDSPVEGVTSTQVNVRAEPSMASNVLGIIPANTKVEITGKDPGEHWWQINYAQGTDGKGWVTAQYVTTTTKPDVRIVGNAVNSNQGNVAIIQQAINVRSGPGTDFNSLGMLNPQDVVGLTGKDANGAWLQIDFPAGGGPEGKGWINAAFVQATGVENLPIITKSGQAIGTGTPTSIPSTPTPTVVPAWDDHDSPISPAVSVNFEENGVETLIYHGDVSVPQGDTEDWIAFQPDSSVIFASLACTGGNSMKIEMTENDLPARLALSCSDQMKPVPVKAGSNYLIHLQALPSSGTFQHIDYILTINMRPS